MGIIPHVGTMLAIGWLNFTPLCWNRCSAGYHAGGCARAAFVTWFEGLARAGRIYLPVHFLPLLIFRCDKTVAFLLSDRNTRVQMASVAQGSANDADEMHKGYRLQYTVPHQLSDDRESDALHLAAWHWN